MTVKDVEVVALTVTFCGGKIPFCTEIKRKREERAKALVLKKMMVNFKLGNKCDKNEIINMTRAWDKEKI